jgi:cation:H+ antiporter
MLDSIFIFVVALAMVIRGATAATARAARIAEHFRLSTYVVGFIIITVISVLPETFIAVSSSLRGIPEFGLGTLFGSNVADLTLIFALLVLRAGRSLKVENVILKDVAAYPFLLLLPLILGLDGRYTSLEGVALLVAGSSFYYSALRKGVGGPPTDADGTGLAKDAAILAGSMALLLAGAHFTVKAASDIAAALGVSPVLIGVLIVGLGTTLPEFFFSLKSVRRHDDSLAIGDILGTVLADATVVIGVMAIVRPFSFSVRIVYVSGAFMAGAALLLIRFMRSGSRLTRREAAILAGYWAAFVAVEFLTNV